MPRDVVVDPDFGPLMHELRSARGLSFRALAPFALSNKSQLQAFEAGTDTPTPECAARIDDALGAGGRLASMVRRAASLQAPGFAGRAVTLWRADRSDTSRLHPSFEPAAYLRALRRVSRGLSRDRRPAASRSSVDIETLLAATSMYNLLDNRFGGGAVRRRVVRFLDIEVAPILAEAEPGSIAHSASAQMTRLAGWSAFDMGLDGLAQAYLLVALGLADEAGDGPLVAEIIAAMAQHCIYARTPQPAGDLARASRRVAAASGVEAIVAEGHLLEAHANALVKDGTACRASLAEAERALDRADRESEPLWIGYLDKAYLSARFGQCLLELGESAPAYRFALASLDMNGKFVRGRQFNLALLAIAQLQLAEVEAAVDTATSAAALTTDLRSARAGGYLSNLRFRLHAYTGLPVVDGFLERTSE